MRSRSPDRFPPTWGMQNQSFMQEFTWNADGFVNTETENVPIFKFTIRTDLRYTMTRFVVDASAVLHVASKRLEVSSQHELLAPTLLRSQTLAILHGAVHGGELSVNVVLDRL